MMILRPFALNGLRSFLFNIKDGTNESLIPSFLSCPYALRTAPSAADATSFAYRAR